MNAGIHDHRAFAHPLAQIKAVLDFRTLMMSECVSGWERDYIDAAPDENDVPTPVQVLTALQATGLRFECSGPNRGGSTYYWDTHPNGDALDVLLFGWAHQAMDALALDSRVFWSGLHDTELIFVPDHEAVVAPALALLHIAERDRVSVWQRLEEDDKRTEGLFKTRELRAKRKGGAS